MTDDTVSVPVSPELLHSIFVTAVAHGIGYWCWCTSFRWSKPDNEKEDDLENFQAVVVDDDDLKKYTIDRAVILKGLCLAVKPGNVNSIIRNEALADIGAGDGCSRLDNCGCDAIVQLGLFGEIVYG